MTTPSSARSRPTSWPRWSARRRERRLFSSVPSRRDSVVVHTDQNFLSRSNRAWGAVNLTIPDDDRDGVPPTITFWQNRLAVLDSRLPEIFVTLNPRPDPEPRGVIAALTMALPLGTAEALAGLSEGNEIQGQDRLWYAGSYLEAPYLHENALKTGLKAAAAILDLAARKRRRASS